MRTEWNVSSRLLYYLYLFNSAFAQICQGYNIIDNLGWQKHFWWNWDVNSTFLFVLKFQVKTFSLIIQHIKLTKWIFYSKWGWWDHPIRDIALSLEHWRRNPHQSRHGSIRSRHSGDTTRIVRNSLSIIHLFKLKWWQNKYSWRNFFWCFFLLFRTS